MKRIIKDFGQFINEHTNGYDNDSNEVSDCCGAPIVMTDICSDCGEHCEPESENEDDFDQDNDSEVKFPKVVFENVNRTSSIDQMLDAIDQAETPEELSDIIDEIGPLDHTQFVDSEYQNGAMEVLSALRNKGPEFEEEFRRIQMNRSEINEKKKKVIDDSEEEDNDFPNLKPKNGAKKEVIKGKEPKAKGNPNFDWAKKPNKKEDKPKVNPFAKKTNTKDDSFAKEAKPKGNPFAKKSNINDIEPKSNPFAKKPIDKQLKKF